MIQEIKTYTCRTCGSPDIVKNGHNRLGQQQYRCKACGARRVLVSRREAKKKDQTVILQAYQERVSMRGLARIFHVARQQVAGWIRTHTQALPPLQATLLPWQPDDVLAGDEAWSFVRTKLNKVWLWTVMCRRPRQIIAFALGDRSDKTCHRLWNRIPDAYRRCASFSDFWEAYQEVLPSATHHPVGKDRGELNHMERWNCILRQRLGRFTHKTLSFSKVDYMHPLMTRWFIVEYNLKIQRAFV